MQLIGKFFKGINYLFGAQLLKNKIAIGNSLNYLGRKRIIDTNYFDYTRIATLELISYEIAKKQLSGSVAELGVYKGKFARYINQYFFDRKLFLFDTFEGFDGRDITIEKKKSYSGGNQDFSYTSTDTVKKIMPFPENCIFKKGYFPETAIAITDDFVFVSIDTDLFEPIYAGLNFFYPKLVKGGYIFVHDFNNDNYLGAREAVEKFCKENGINFLPIPDSGGSVIICK